METKHIKDYRSFHDVLVKPLTLTELEEQRKKDGTIRVKLVVDLFDLIDNDMEWLNDEVSERITDSTCGLTDLSYKVAGRTTNDEVIIAVTGNVDDILAEEDI